MRGLKRNILADFYGEPYPVAPHAGAWIETPRGVLRRSLKGSSHPTRVRGLKRGCHLVAMFARTSHPTRVRG